MLRITLFTIALVFAGCASKEKTAEAKAGVKKSAKKMAKKVMAKTGSTASETAVAETMEAITCSYNNDNRKISSVKLNNGGCEVHYEKLGVKTVVATARYDLGYCSQMANKVSNNLEEAGFTCK